MLPTPRPLRPATRRDDEWVGGVFQLPAYVTDRPTLAAWMDASSRMILASEVLPAGAKAGALAEVLARAMADPASDAHGHRPRRVRLGDAAAVEAVHELLGAGTKVAVAEVPELNEFKNGFADYDGQAGRTPSEPELAYVAAGRVGAAEVGAAFAAAAEFWSAAPWRYARDSQTLKLSVGALGLPSACVSILGNAGPAHGLLVFKSGDGFRAHLKVAQRMMAANRRGPIRSAGADFLSLSFEPLDRVTAGMRGEIERYGWRVAHPGACPVFWHVGRDATPRPPVADDYRLLIVAMLAILKFSAKHFRAFSNQSPSPRPRVEAFNIPAPGTSDTLSTTVTFPYAD